MEQNNLQFPQLKCAEHKSPIILVSHHFQENEKNIFCSRCISLGANKRNESLMVIEDFISYISTPHGINVEPSDEAQTLLKERQEAVQNFNTHIDNQKNLVSNISTELLNQQQDKFKEMIIEFKDVLDGQSDLLNNYQHRLQEQIGIDHENEATIPKFEEILKKVNELNDMVEIESYLTKIIRQKEAWRTASNSLRTFGTRTENFFTQQIQNITSNNPTFSSQDAIIQMWNRGLNQLIQRVKTSSGCFSNLHQVTSGIVINILDFQELDLLTNSMIKCGTQLFINSSKKSISLQQATQMGSQLSSLTNLRTLSLTLESNLISATNFELILQGISALTGLTSLSINIDGNKIGDNFSATLGNTLGQLVNLQSLLLEVGMNELTSVSITNIFSQLINLSQLRSFSFDAKYNKINDITALANFTSTLNANLLTSFNISLGGFSVSRNQLTLESSRQLLRSIRHLINLSSLVLDLGYTGLDNFGIMELSQSLRGMNQLQNIHLQLYSNAIEASGASKLAKRITKISKLENIVLNLNNNDRINLEGATNVVSAFRQMTQLTELDLQLIKVGVDKEHAITLKEDLTRNKVGTPFNKVLVVF